MVKKTSKRPNDFFSKGPKNVLSNLTQTVDNYAEQIQMPNYFTTTDYKDVIRLQSKCRDRTN